MIIKGSLEVQLLTLGYVIKGGDVLLGRRKEEFAKGLLCGYGGKDEKGETPRQCLDRETRKEGLFLMVDPVEVGIIDFYFPHKNRIRRVRIYTSSDLSGTVQETEDMAPVWVPKAALLDKDDPLYDEMFPGDRFWLPQVIAGKKAYGRVTYSEKLELLGEPQLVFR